MRGGSVRPPSLLHHAPSRFVRSSLTLTTFVSEFMNSRERYVFALWQREPIAVALYSTYSPEGEVWKRCGPFDCEVSRDGKEYVHSRDQEAHAVGTTLIRQCAEVLFCLLCIHSTPTVCNLTHQHLDGHLPPVDVLVLHAFCSHISTPHFFFMRFTLKAHAHRLSDPTSPYPCVYPPPRSFAGTKQARSAFCP